MPRDDHVDTETLLTCCLLQLDPRVEDKRLELHRNLIELALMEAGGPCGPEAITQSVDSIVGQSGFLPAVHTGAIQPVNGQYALADHRRAEIDEAVRADRDNRGRFARGLIERIEIEIVDSLDPRLAGEIPKLVDRMVRTVIYDNSLRIARDLVTIEDAVADLDRLDAWAEFQAALDDLAAPQDRLRRSLIRGGIQAYFRDLPSEAAHYLRSAHCALILNQMLSLDPRTQAVQQAWFAARRFYLDTNVVLACLCEGQDMHEAVREVVDATRRLGCQLLVSPTTLEELQGQVDRARWNYGRCKDDPRLRQLVAAGDDAILATYFRLRLRQPSLEWEPFIERYDAMEEVLFDELGILVEDEWFEQACTSDRLPRIRSVVTSAKASWKSEQVIKHDALNCCLVYGLRGTYGPDERGQTLWLLTMDSTLRHVQRELVSSGEASSPYCLSVDDWGTIALSAVETLAFELDDFMAFLARSKLGALPQSEYVQLDFLETIRDAPLDVDRLLQLPPQHARRAIVRLQTDWETRKLLEDSAQAEDEGARAAFRGELDARVAEAVQQTDPLLDLRDRYDRRIALLNRNLEEKGERIRQLEDHVQALDQMSLLDKLRYLLGFRSRSR
jgi:hypothetical protein